MQFDSYTYALFLPIVFLAYWAARRRLSAQNAVLLVASYVFYGWWDWRMLGLVLLTSVSTFASGLMIRPGAKDRRSKAAAVANITLNIGILAAFKYFNFFKDTFVQLLQCFGMTPDWPTANIILPVGISFYTFQAISYTIDVYRGDVKPTRNMVAFLVFISFFPQLVAGPIERAKNLLPQFLHKKEFDYATAVTGMRQILWGLAKKVVIANVLAGYVDYVFYHPAVMSAPSLLLGIALFTVQIYADFSGYSDIAIGSARLLNIRLSVNFSYPLFSRSMRELWRRWHITLMRWFADYVYIPLGGSRRGRWRTVANLMAVFTLSGLWHGADWTFIIWGMANGVLVVLCRLWPYGRNCDHSRPPQLRDAPRMAVTFGLFALTFFLFRATSMAHLGEIAGTLVHGQWAAMPMGVSALCYVVPFIGIEWIGRKSEFPLMRLTTLPTAVRWTAYWGLLALVAWKSIGQDTQFIYFQF